jgi:hypothetical protein
MRLNQTYQALQTHRRRRSADRFEDQLTREKAERLTHGELADEIKRCQRGVEVAANPTAKHHFARRLAIMNAEAEKRMASAGGAR